MKSAEKLTQTRKPKVFKFRSQLRPTDFSYKFPLITKVLSFPFGFQYY